MSLRAARDAADRTRLDLKAGKNPNREKQEKRESAIAASSAPTLAELLLEYEQAFGGSKSIWSMRGPRSTKSGARSCIQLVFARLLDKKAEEVTEAQFSKQMTVYRPVKPVNGKSTANGQVSRARLYLMPVLDWAAGRKSHAKVGASRNPKLNVVSLANLHDPATSDDTTKGKSERVLMQQELEAILPLLIYPAPEILKMGLSPEQDYRPIALRFLIYTAARREELVTMRWRDVDFTNGIWHKPKVKATKGGPRGQDLPLSKAALDILKSLPGSGAKLPDAYVFPNARGGTLGNWERFQTVIENASGTTGWHRHDLRRTAATIMKSLKVSPSTIEQILAHKDPLRSEGVGGSASHYMSLAKVLTNVRDHQEEALSVLAEALDLIVGSGRAPDSPKLQCVKAG